MVILDLQNDEAIDAVPDLEHLTLWVESSLQESYDNLEQTIRVVGEAEMQALNFKFRHINSPTNVLSFSSDQEYLDYQCLGDLVICAPVVKAEAAQQNKTEITHWAHMVIHGMLHLQDYDHQTEVEAEQMEALEVEILSNLGYINPYNSETVL